MITCSNCCDCYDLYWFPFSESGSIGSRVKTKIVFEPQDNPGLVKVASYPFVVDWDGDGDSDVVFCNRNRRMVPGESGAEPRYVTKNEFFLSKTESVESDPSGEASTNHAAGNNWKFEKLDLEIDGRQTSRFAFGDYDGDGRTDLLQSRFSRFEDGKRSLSGIYLWRDSGKSGVPEFAPPETIFEAPKGWQINSIAIEDLDNDGQAEVVCAIYDESKEDLDKMWLKDSEIWLLDR